MEWLLGMAAVMVVVVVLIMISRTLDGIKDHLAAIKAQLGTIDSYTLSDIASDVSMLADETREGWRLKQER